MTQPQSSSFYSTGNYGGIQQEQGSMGVARTQPHPQPRSRQFPNLPPDVRLPPSFNQQQKLEYTNRPPIPHIPSRSVYQMHPPASNYPPVSNPNPVNHTPPLTKSLSNQSVNVTEVQRLLEEVENENNQLREVIQQNNEMIASKINGMEKMSMELKRVQEQNDVLKRQLEASTNQFFEARVAVLGFKCRVMQLQAQEGAPTKHTTPPQQLGPHEINAQIGTLTQENRELLNENKSLETVVAEERRKLSQLADKKRLAIEENERLQAKITQLEGDYRLMEDRLGEAQNFSYQEHSSRSQLSQQLRDLETENKRLINQLKSTSRRDTELTSQVQSLRTREKELSQEIHHLKTQSPQPPVPKPRTNVQAPQTAPLQPEIDRLQNEVRAIRDKLDKEQQCRETLEKRLEGKNGEHQKLLMKFNSLRSEHDSLKQQQGNQSSVRSVEVERLSTELSQLKMSETKSARSVHEKDLLIQRITAEKNDLQAKVTTLERQKIEITTLQREKRDELARLRQEKHESEGKVASLEERLRLAQTATGAKGGGISSAGIAKRLNDALGKNKELETRLANQTKDYDADRKEWDRQLQSEINRLTVEREEQLHEVEAILQRNDEDIAELKAQERALLEEKRSLEVSLQQASQDLSRSHGLTQQLSQLRTDYEEKSREADALRGELENMSKEKEKKSTKLQHLSNEYSDLKENASQARTRQKELEAEKKRLAEENAQINITTRQLTDERNRLIVDKQGLERLVQELQLELTKLDQDHESSFNRLSSTESELSQLSVLNQQLSSELEENRARILEVEQSRDGMQERLKHMDAQLKIYQEDFERERQAREAAVKVRNMVEDRIAKKEKEVKELRERLNQQALSTLQDDDGQYEDHSDPVSIKPHSRRPIPPDHHSLSPSPSSHHRSSEQLHLTTNNYQPPEPTRPYPNPPNDISVTRRSRELSGPQRPPRESDSLAPPIPPRAPVSHQDHQPFQRGGGFRSHDQMWTQQLPVSNQMPLSGPRARPMTTVVPEPGTAGGGMMGGVYPPAMAVGPSYHQGSYSQQPSEGVWRPSSSEFRRNDFSMTPGRNNFSPSLQSRNNLDMLGPSSQLQAQYPADWVGPGEVMNKAPPSMACPICGQQDFQTQTDLELHCAQCT